MTLELHPQVIAQDKGKFTFPGMLSTADIEVQYGGRLVTISPTAITSDGDFSINAGVGGEIVFNDDQNNVNFRIESNVNANFFMIDADAGLDSEGAIGIGAAYQAAHDGMEAKVRVYSGVGESIYGHLIEMETGPNIQVQSTHGNTANWGSGFILRHGRGTLASPLNTQSADRLGFLLWGGVGSGSWGNHVGLQAFANEEYSATARGTRLEFVGTADGSTARLIRMIMQEGLQVGPTPTGGDKGVGTINVSGDIYKNNTAYANPDFVLEHYYRGEIEKFKDNPGASEYSGLLDLAEVEEFMKENLHLPGIPRSPLGVFDRGDVTLMLLEQIFLYLIEHQRQLQEINPLLN